MQPVTGRANTYPRGQCTWWAAERYYQVHALFPPAWGNASAWLSGAQRDGWTVSTTPIAQSIICLQPGVQGANLLFGHVGFVESVNGNQVTASNQNWGGVTYPNVASVAFQTGPGVSFLSAVGGGSMADPCLKYGPVGSDPYIHCQGQIASGHPPSGGGAALPGADLWGNLNAWVSQPTRIVKAVLGVALILAGLALLIKAVVPPQVLAAVGA
jgi:hypothetical protein